MNSTERNFTHAKLTKQIESIDEKLTDYLQRLDRCDAQEAEASTARAGRLTEKTALPIQPALPVAQRRALGSAANILQDMERVEQRMPRGYAHTACIVIFRRSLR